MGRTPEVFWFPLLFCTTPTFAGAVFEFRFELTFAELLLEVVLLQPPRPTTASRHITSKVRFILFLPSRHLFSDKLVRRDVFSNLPRSRQRLQGYAVLRPLRFRPS